LGTLCGTGINILNGGVKKALKYIGAVIKRLNYA
jgi:hypothetical protein